MICVVQLAWARIPDSTIKLDNFGCGTIHWCDECTHDVVQATTHFPNVSTVQTLYDKL
jgi:hypothetical protein